MDARKTIEDILNAHAAKAQNSAYDRDTCVLAILSAREALMTIPDDVQGSAYLQTAQQKIDALFDRYHDPDGEYTSGRGVIGALRDDIYIACK